MYDISTKNLKKGILNHLGFFIGGMFFVVIIFWDPVVKYVKHLSMDSKTIGTRVELPNEGRVNEDQYFNALYYYKVDNHEYSCYKMETYSSTKHYDSNATIEYNSKNPSKCMVGYEKQGIFALLLFSSLPLVFIIVSTIKMIKLNNRIKLIKQLNKNGKLIKDLPYELEYSNVKINGKKMYRPVINYQLSSGSVIQLKGDLRYDCKLSGDDEFVDLVIDENNPNNFFIDYDINRLSGNLPTDYYKNKNN